MGLCGGGRSAKKHKKRATHALASLPPTRPVAPHPSLSLLADCADAASRLAVGPCAALVPVFNAHAGELAAFTSATPCPSLKARVDAWLPAGLATGACCEVVRAFAADGCVCDPAVADLLTGLRVLPPGTPPGPTIAGAVALVQAGPCSAAAYGGALLEACSGSVGCGPDLASVWDAAVGGPAGA